MARLTDAFPWTEHLKPEGVAEFEGELAAVVTEGDLVKVVTLIAAWRSTAAIMADPELYEELTTGELADFGPVPEPIVPAKAD